MSINFKCPKCRKAFKLADNLAGRRGKCPDCGSQFKIPASKAAVTQEMPPMPDNPFGALEYGESVEGGESYQPRRRRRGGFLSQLFGCLFLLVFLLVATVGGAYAAVYFKLIKRDVAEPYLARIPFKIPGLTTGPKPGEATAPEDTAKGTSTETAGKDGGNETKKEDPATAVAGDYRYLPDKFALLVSVNVEKLLATKIFKDNQKLIPGADKKSPDETAKAGIGVEPGDIARIIVGAHTKDDLIMVFRTKQPITADNVKKNRKSEFTEIKVGKHVIYDAKVAPFCVPDERTLLIGETADSLKKVLERERPPEMVPDLQMAFSRVTPDKTICIAFGPQDVRAELEKALPQFGDLKAIKDLQPLLDSQVFALQLDVGPVLELSAMLQCKDAAGAEMLKKTVEEKLALAKVHLEKEAKSNEAAKGVLQALNQSQLATNGDTLNLHFSLSDNLVLDAGLMGIAALMSMQPKKN